MVSLCWFFPLQILLPQLPSHSCLQSSEFLSLHTREPRSYSSKIARRFVGFFFHSFIVLWICRSMGAKLGKRGHCIFTPLCHHHKISFCITTPQLPTRVTHSTQHRLFPPERLCTLVRGPPHGDKLSPRVGCRLFPGLSESQERAPRGGCDERDAESVYGAYLLPAHPQQLLHGYQRLHLRRRTPQCTQAGRDLRYLRPVGTGSSQGSHERG